MTNGTHDGKHFDIPVVVYGLHAVRLQVEVVDHIHVFDVGGRRLVRDIHGVFQRKIPDGEGFKLRIARLHAAFVFVIKLPKTRRKFSAVGARGVYDNQRTRRFDVRILAVAFVGHNRIDVGGIPFREPVHINLNAARFQLVLYAIADG